MEKCQSHVDSHLVCFPGPGSTHSACSNPPPHSHCPSSDTKPAPPPSRHGGDHEPIGPHQHRVHVETEPGHHCAGMCYFQSLLSDPTLKLSFQSICESLLQRSVLFVLSSQAIQHIERTQERRASAEEEQRRAVIVGPTHVAMDTACSDTDTDTEGEDCSMN